MVYLMRADFECNGIVAIKVWILIFCMFSVVGFYVIDFVCPNEGVYKSQGKEQPLPKFLQL